MAHATSVSNQDTSLSLIQPACHLSHRYPCSLMPRHGKHDIIIIVSPCDLVIGQLELGEEDGAVLSPSAVNDGDDLVTPAHGPHQPEVLN